ncbi:MAG TPA: hypothetical protein VLL52_22280, partial [Anaerolineae bacterium]|nr:hypothetical protein [Anaerolineae bacterium]
MGHFYLQSLSISHFTQLVCAGTLVFYLASLREKTKAVWWALSFAVFGFILISFEFISSSVWYAPWAHLLNWLSVLPEAGLVISLVQFAYVFPVADEGWTKEASWGLRFSLVAYIVVAIYISYNYYAEFNNLDSFWRGDWRLTVVVIHFLWGMITAGRQLWRWSRTAAPGAAWYWHWWRPAGRPAQSAQRLLSIFGVLVVGYATLLLFEINGRWYDLIISVTVIIALVAFYLVLLNDLPA